MIILLKVRVEFPQIQFIGYKSSKIDKEFKYFDSSIKKSIWPSNNKISTNSKEYLFFRNNQFFGFECSTLML